MLVPAVIFFALFGLISAWCSLMDILHDIRTRVTAIEYEVTSLPTEIRSIQRNQISSGNNDHSR